MSKPQIKIAPLGRIDPLPAQFGAAEPRFVPEGLEALLFPPSGPEQTYLIMDGSDMRGGLAEVLAASSLEHACLLNGALQEEQELSAPWIVRLTDDSPFTRDVFTYEPQRPAPWHLWRHAPGLLIRSAATLDTLRSHFRKFLRIKDSNGKAFFLRFWECGPMLDYLHRVEHPEHMAQTWLQTSTGDELELILPISGYCYHCSAEGLSDCPPLPHTRGSQIMTDADQAALYDGALRSRASRILYHMERYNSDVFADRDREALILQAVATIKRMGRYRVTSGRDVARAVRLEVLLRSPLEAWDKTGHLAKVLQSDLRESRKLDLVEAHVDAVFSQPISA